jgi:hypothetical protein
VNVNDLTDDQVARLVGIARVTVRGRGGRPANIQTVRGYCRDGFKPNGWRGPPVRLRAVRLGQDYCTLPEWVADFERERAALAQRLFDASRRPPVTAPAPLSRAASARRAREHLDRAGVR